MIEAGKQTYEHILFKADVPVARVTMNRPEKRNVLSLAHMQELTSCLKAIGEARERRVVVLGGNGPAFCAGHDLSEMIGRDPDTYRHIFDVCCELMETVHTPAGHSEGPRDRDGRRLPARRHLRPHCRLGESSLRDPRGEDRAVLLHPDGGPEPRDRTEKSDGDAPHR